MFDYEIRNNVMFIYRDDYIIETVPGVSEDDARIGMYLDDAVFAYC